ncbi:hypothetical protein RRG08_035751 [Elysia crispata]|uniref:Uncharacterized protein n=1 Tax=Elysia crispata TaxID=231223 RepID=A0AAE0ZLS6_9GAST|nr:hypothetical protein RRG08_035751 [Elysia crispata]
MDYLQDCLEYDDCEWGGGMHDRGPRNDFGFWTNNNSSNNNNNSQVRKAEIFSAFLDFPFCNKLLYRYKTPELKKRACPETINGKLRANFSSLFTSATTSISTDYPFCHPKEIPNPEATRGDLPSQLPRLLTTYSPLHQLRRKS